MRSARFSRRAVLACFSLRRTTGGERQDERAERGDASQRHSLSHDWSAKDLRTDFLVNTCGTVNVLEATRNHVPNATSNIVGRVVERVDRGELEASASLARRLEGAAVALEAEGRRPSGKRVTWSL
jgi:hypothetical protein